MPAYRSLISGFAQLAEEVGQASRANRELFEQLVAAEVGRVAARLGVVPAADLRETREQLAAARDEVGDLRVELDELQLRVAVLEAAMPEPEDPLAGAPDLLDDETTATVTR